MSFWRDAVRQSLPARTSLPSDPRTTVRRLMAATSLILGLVVGAGAVFLWARGRIAAERLAADAQLAPIKETLQKFEAQAKALEERRLGDVSRIGEQLRFVAEGQEKLRAETGSLVTALRTPHVRGRWGEVQLKRVVELAGMLDHCDFRTQASARDDEGSLLRPDLVVQLPGGKSIVVDSKVPIEAYLQASAIDDLDARRAQLARHAAQVRDHVGKLGQKRYWQQFEPSPEFVVMFVDEGLYRAALDQDPSLFEAGVDAGVIIASPATLVALLRTVAYTWQ